MSNFNHTKIFADLIRSEIYEYLGLSVSPITESVDDFCRSNNYKQSSIVRVLRESGAGFGVMKAEFVTSKIADLKRDGSDDNYISRSMGFPNIGSYRRFCSVDNPLKIYRV